MKLSILGSGSSGNTIYVEKDDTAFLIDAGFSCKKIEERLVAANADINKIRAILITHEHSDHISGAGIFSRKYDIPIYITEKSFTAGKEKLGKLEEKNIKIIKNSFDIESSFFITPFEVMHDAEMTIGFNIKDRKNKKMAVATDIGYITNSVKEHFKYSDVVLIESNYDYNMLMNGPYPWDLKNRVKGKNGHLSNNECAKFVKSIYHIGLQKVYLVHISKDNNTYDIAYNTSKEHFYEEKIKVEIETAEQDKVTKIFEIR